MPYCPICEKCLYSNGRKGSENRKYGLGSNLKRHKALRPPGNCGGGRGSRIGPGAVALAAAAAANLNFNIISTKCGHLYHQGCLNEYITNYRTKGDIYGTTYNVLCPLCGANLSNGKMLRIDLEAHFGILEEFFTDLCKLKYMNKELKRTLELEWQDISDLEKKIANAKAEYDHVKGIKKANEQKCAATEDRIAKAIEDASTCYRYREIEKQLIDENVNLEAVARKMETIISSRICTTAYNSSKGSTTTNTAETMNIVEDRRNNNTINNNNINNDVVCHQKINTNIHNETENYDKGDKNNNTCENESVHQNSSHQYQPQHQNSTSHRTKVQPIQEVETVEESVTTTEEPVGRENSRYDHCSNNNHRHILSSESHDPGDRKNNINKVVTINNRHEGGGEGHNQADYNMSQQTSKDVGTLLKPGQGQGQCQLQVQLQESQLLPPPSRRVTARGQVDISLQISVHSEWSLNSVGEVESETVLLKRYEQQGKRLEVCSNSNNSCSGSNLSIDMDHNDHVCSEKYLSDTSAVEVQKMLSSIQLSCSADDREQRHQQIQHYTQSNNNNNNKNNSNTGDNYYVKSDKVCIKSNNNGDGFITISTAPSLMELDYECECESEWRSGNELTTTTVTSTSTAVRKVHAELPPIQNHHHQQHQEVEQMSKCTHKTIKYDPMQKRLKAIEANLCVTVDKSKSYTVRAYKPNQHQIVVSNNDNPPKNKLPTQLISLSPQDSLCQHHQIHCNTNNNNNNHSHLDEANVDLQRQPYLGFHDNDDNNNNANVNISDADYEPDEGEAPAQSLIPLNRSISYTIQRFENSKTRFDSENKHLNNNATNSFEDNSCLWPPKQFPSDESIDPLLRSLLFPPPHPPTPNNYCTTTSTTTTTTTSSTNNRQKRLNRSNYHQNPPITCQNSSRMPIILPPPTGYGNFNNTTATTLQEESLILSKFSMCLVPSVHDQLKSTQDNSNSTGVHIEEITQEHPQEEDHQRNLAFVMVNSKNNNSNSNSKNNSPRKGKTLAIQDQICKNKINSDNNSHLWLAPLCSNKVMNNNNQKNYPLRRSQEDAMALVPSPSRSCTHDKHLVITPPHMFASEKADKLSPSPAKKSQVPHTLSLPPIPTPRTNNRVSNETQNEISANGNKEVPVVSTSQNNPSHSSDKKDGNPKSDGGILHASDLILPPPPPPLAVSKSEMDSNLALVVPPPPPMSRGPSSSLLTRSNSHSGFKKLVASRPPSCETPESTRRLLESLLLISPPSTPESVVPPPEKTEKNHQKSETKSKSSDQYQTKVNINVNTTTKTNSCSTSSTTSIIAPPDLFGSKENENQANIVVSLKESEDRLLNSIITNNYNNNVNSSSRDNSNNNNDAGKRSQTLENTGHISGGGGGDVFEEGQGQVQVGGYPRNNTLPDSNSSKSLLHQCVFTTTTTTTESSSQQQQHELQHQATSTHTLKSSSSKPEYTCLAAERFAQDTCLTSLQSSLQSVRVGVEPAEEESQQSNNNSLQPTHGHSSGHGETITTDVIQNQYCVSKHDEHGHPSHQTQSHHRHNYMCVLSPPDYYSGSNINNPGRYWPFENNNKVSTPIVMEQKKIMPLANNHHQHRHMHNINIIHSNVTGTEDHGPGHGHSHSHGLSRIQLDDDYDDNSEQGQKQQLKYRSSDNSMIMSTCIRPTPTYFPSTPSNYTLLRSRRKSSHTSFNTTTLPWLANESHVSLPFLETQHQHLQHYQFNHHNHRSHHPQHYNIISNNNVHVSTHNSNHSNVSSNSHGCSNINNNYYHHYLENNNIQPNRRNFP